MLVAYHDLLGGWCKGVGLARVSCRAGPRTVGAAKHVTSNSPSVQLSLIHPSPSPNGNVHNCSRFFISALSYARALRPQ